MSTKLEEQKIANRYTKALFDAAIEGKALDNVENDLNDLNQLVTESPELLAFLNNPAIPHSEKDEFVEKQLVKNLHEVTGNLVKILSGNARMGIIPFVSEQFSRLKRERENVSLAEVVTAVKIDKKLQDKVVKQLKAMFGFEDVTIENKVDPGILGGVIIKIGDKVIDGSYVGRLEKLRQEVS